jgi:hypothetical protein
MTPRVLIVEDESLLVMVLEDLLPDLGYQVAATANSVESALQVLDAQAIDLARRPSRSPTPWPRAASRSCSPPATAPTSSRRSMPRCR